MIALLTTALAAVVGLVGVMVQGVRADMRHLRTELRAEMSELRGEMGELREEMGELTRRFDLHLERHHA